MADFFLVWWSGVFAGFFAKNGAQRVIFCVVDATSLW